jgi:hypothetical protein
MRLAGRIFLLALGVNGCASHSSLDTPISDPAALSRLEPEPAVLPPPDPLRELFLQVAAARGLEPGPTPAVVALPARQLARRALEQFAQDVPEGVRRAQAQLLARLELVPPDFDLSEALESAWLGQLQALYVGTPPTLFVDRALSGAARRRALAHELVHTLQDQRHGLLRRLAYEAEGWDRQSALHALAEADALAVVEHLGGSAARQSAGFEPETPSADVPGVIACSLAAPYLDARARVNELLASGGFAALDALFDDPPRSTHQLLHPGEPAGSPSAEPALLPPGSDWSVTYHDVLGEQSLRCVLEQWVSDAVAATLAGGWAADRVSSFAGGGESAIVWELTFDRPTRAADVAQLLVAHLDLRPASGRASAPVAEWSCGAQSDSGVVGVLRRGVRVVFASLSVPVPGGCVSLERWIRGTRFGPA